MTDFCVQFILKGKEVVGAELLVRGSVRPSLYSDSYIFAKSVEVAKKLFYNSCGFIIPHVNLYCTSLFMIYELYDGSFPLVIEILENGLEGSALEQLVVDIQDLRLHFRNLRFALDDFGTGTCNFHVLSRMRQGSDEGLLVRNVDIVKVDAEVVPSQIAVGLVQYAKQLGLRVYVEKATEKEVPGADGYQSFFLHKPVPVEQIMDRCPQIFLGYQRP